MCMCFRNLRQHYKFISNKRSEIFCEFWLLPPFFCFLVVVFPESLMKGNMELSHSCCIWGSPSPLGSSAVLFLATAICTP